MYDGSWGGVRDRLVCGVKREMNLNRWMDHKRVTGSVGGA